MASTSTACCTGYTHCLCYVDTARTEQEQCAGCCAHHDLRPHLHCCRYFTVPFVLLALHMLPPTPWQLAAMGAAYAAVDAATVYMFLFRPFTWPDGSVARFMW